MRFKLPRGAKADGDTSEHRFDPSRIDLMTISPDGATAILYIVQAHDWTGSEAQIASLQAKIHAYVGYALDGQMTTDHPQTSELAWTIVIDCQTEPPDPRTADTLRHVGAAVRRYGGDLSTTA